MLNASSTHFDPNLTCGPEPKYSIPARPHRQDKSSVAMHRAGVGTRIIMVQQGRVLETSVPTRPLAM